MPKRTLATDHVYTTHQLTSMAYLQSYSIVLTKVPTPWETQHRTSSPSLSHNGGVWLTPIPGGVPVMITDPAGRVDPCERYEMTLLSERCLDM